MGFEPGFSIAHNARYHCQMAVVIKMDIKDFFPNTTADRVEHYFRRIGWDKSAAALLTELVTYNHVLPQGAPTSPRLSNLINYKMDAILDLIAKRFRGGYSRYADDITISYPQDFPSHVRGTVQRVARCVQKFGYQINHRKTHILRQHQQQRVTGLVVNDKVNLPREKRRWLRAVEHRLKTQGQASLTQEQLDGYKALQQMIRQHADASQTN
jgi:retron-type reverse transcriptase